MVSAVCQFPNVQSTIEATVAVMQSSIPVARIGLSSLALFQLVVLFYVAFELNSHNFYNN